MPQLIAGTPETTCCGLPMSFRQVFGIRIWSCSYRAHHPMKFENLCTGDVIDEDTLEYKHTVLDQDGEDTDVWGLPES